MSGEPFFPPLFGVLVELSLIPATHPQARLALEMENEIAQFPPAGKKNLTVTQILNRCLTPATSEHCSWRGSGQNWSVRKHIIYKSNAGFIFRLTRGGAAALRLAMLPHPDIPSFIPVSAESGLFPVSSHSPKTHAGLKRPVMD